MPLKEGSVRQARIAGEISRIVAETLERDHRSKLHGMVSISSVSVTRDLKTAKVYYSVFGTPGDVLFNKQYLVRHTGFFRHAVAKGLTIRSVPELIFEYDPSGERAARIEELIDKINAERDNIDRG